MSGAAPSFRHGLSAIFRLQLRRFRRGRRIHIAAGSALLVVLAVAGVRHASGDALGDEAFSRGLKWGIYHLLAFVLPYLFTANAIGDEVVSRTLPYLTGRPVSRWAIAGGKYLAGWAISVAILVPTVLVMHLAVNATDFDALMESLPLALKAMASLTLLSGFYCALCLLAGAIFPDATGVAALMYFGLIELLLGLAPYARVVSMSFLAQSATGLAPSGPYAEGAPEVPLYVAAPVLAAMALLFALLAGLAVRTSEYASQRA